MMMMMVMIVTVVVVYCWRRLLWSSSVVKGGRTVEIGRMRKELQWRGIRSGVQKLLPLRLCRRHVEAVDDNDIIYSRRVNHWLMTDVICVLVGTRLTPVHCGRISCRDAHRRIEWFRRCSLHYRIHAVYTLHRSVSEMMSDIVDVSFLTILLRPTYSAFTLRWRHCKTESAQECKFSINFVHFLPVLV